MECWGRLAGYQPLRGLSGSGSIPGMSIFSFSGEPTQGVDRPGDSDREILRSDKEPRYFLRRNMKHHVTIHSWVLPDKNGMKSWKCFRCFCPKRYSFKTKKEALKFQKITTEYFDYVAHGGKDESEGE